MIILTSYLNNQTDFSTVSDLKTFTFNVLTGSFDVLHFPTKIEYFISNVHAINMYIFYLLHPSDATVRLYNSQWCY